MPFGISRVVSKSGNHCEHGVETIMVWGATEAEHDRNLLGLLTRAREVNLIMKTCSIFSFSCKNHLPWHLVTFIISQVHLDLSWRKHQKVLLALRVRFCWYSQKVIYCMRIPILGVVQTVHIILA